MRPRTNVENRLKSLRLPPGYRLIKELDRDAIVLSGVLQMDSYQPRYYLNQSKLPDQIVIVHVRNRVVVAVCHLIIRTGSSDGPAYLELDMLNVDRTVRSQHIGTVMVGIAEDVARQLGLSELRLEALTEELVSYYQRFGFQVGGSPVSYPGWGPVHPMRKDLR